MAPFEYASMEYMENMAKRQATLSVSENSTENGEKTEFPRPRLPIFVPDAKDGVVVRDSSTFHTSIYLIVYDNGLVHSVYLDKAAASKALVDKDAYILTLKLPTDTLTSTKPSPHEPVLEFS